MRGHYLFHLAIICMAFITGCHYDTTEIKEVSKNPFFVEFNKPINYGDLNATHIEEYYYAMHDSALLNLTSLRQSKVEGFDLFTRLDKIAGDLFSASMHCNMIGMESPDSLSRTASGKYKVKLDSFYTVIFSDSALYQQMNSFRQSPDFNGLDIVKKNQVDYMI